MRIKKTGVCEIGSKKKGIGNILLAGLLIVAAMNTRPLEVKAATAYMDQESNDSFAEAQFIARNSMSAANTVSGNTTGYKYVTGNLTGREDEDWYWLMLSPEFDSYLTIDNATGTINIDVLDEKETVLYTFSYNGVSGAENIFNIRISDTGFYYFRLYHDDNTTVSYRFMVGNPEYHFDSYTHSFGRQTLPAKGTWEDVVDLRAVSVIPRGAIGYRITVSGCSTTVCSKRYFSRESSSGWAATNTTYMKDLPVVDASLLAQEWGVRYISASKSNEIFTPQFKIDYVYPDLPANER